MNNELDEILNEIKEYGMTKNRMFTKKNDEVGNLILKGYFKKILNNYKQFEFNVTPTFANYNQLAQFNKYKLDTIELYEILDDPNHNVTGFDLIKLFDCHINALSMLLAAKVIDVEITNK